ncbi:MAG: type II toxin-antitoxin system VapC family toxin [bacterium]|nr:type II toxin-antitoxin system VapC family toxin [bacterium]
MILDSSAVVSIVSREPGFEHLIGKLRQADVVGVGTPTLTEIGLVLEGRFGLDAQSILTRFLRDFEVVIVPFADLHWQESISAYSRFGKGRHPAALNFGDCLSYATAKLAARPLLFVGDDFTKTDLEPA